MLMESLLIIGTHYRIEMSKIHSSYRAILTMKLQERYFPLLTDESVVAQYSKVLCLGPNAGKCCTRDRSLCVSAVPGSVLKHGARGWRVTVPLCRSLGQYIQHYHPIRDRILFRNDFEGIWPILETKEVD